MAKFLVSKYYRSYQNSLKKDFGWRIWDLLKLNEESKSIHQIVGEILKEPVLNLKNKTPFVLTKSTILSTFARNTDVGLTKIPNNLADGSTFLNGSQNTASTRRGFSDATDKQKRCRKSIPCKKKRRRPKKSDACKRDPNDVCARQAAFKCFDPCEQKPVRKTKTTVALRSIKDSCNPLCISATEAKRSGKCKKSVPCKDREELERLKMKAKEDDCKKKNPCSMKREDPCKPKEKCKEPCLNKKMDPCKVVRGDPCKKNDDLTKCK